VRVRPLRMCWRTIGSHAGFSHSADRGQAGLLGGREGGWQKLVNVTPMTHLPVLASRSMVGWTKEGDGVGDVSEHR
jgi:hypothetical protein